MRGAWVTALALTLALGWPAAAQEPAGQIRSPILTIDQDRLFRDSRAGQEMVQALEVDSAALAAENRRIEAELVAEELDLTTRRANLPSEDFQALAKAFDEKVVSIRREQDAKARALAQRRETDQQDFYRRALPLVAEIVRERGAVAVLERGTVILAADQIDITDSAIALIDAEFAEPTATEGATETPAPPEPAAEDSAPDPVPEQ